MAVDPWSYAAKTRSEHAEQVALFMWAAMAERFGLNAAIDPEAYTVKGKAQLYKQDGSPLVPKLKWLHAISNHGAGFGRQAEGVKAGVADIFLPVPIVQTVEHDGYWSNDIMACGLYIELKRLDSVGKKAGTPSDKQIQFQGDMRIAGYKHEIIYGWELARDCILSYLGRN